MLKLSPHIETQGSGPTVICLHCSAGSSKQWRPLAEMISDRYHVVGVDLYGYGKTGDWPNDERLSLDDEAELLSGIIKEVGEPVHLVGHSYGGAVALTSAFKYSGQVRSVIVYEPVMFHVLFQIKETFNMAREIIEVQSDMCRYLINQEPYQAARRFVDYWSVPGAFDSMPDFRKDSLALKMNKVLMDFSATMGYNYQLPLYQFMDIPVKFMIGGQSPQPVRSIAAILQETIPGGMIERFTELGHMGPVTNPEIINAAIAEFLDRQPVRKMKPVRPLSLGHPA